jgi:hypothetical protein
VKAERRGRPGLKAGRVDITGVHTETVVHSEPTAITASSLPRQCGERQSFYHALVYGVSERVMKQFCYNIPFPYYSVFARVSDSSQQRAL